MNELLRTTVAGAAGAVVATAVLAGAPAIADELKAKKITSAMIKNGTIKRADLNADVNASLVKADTALQGIADGSVVTVKLADGSVTTAKLADGAVTSSKVLAESLTAADLAVGSVSTLEVYDGSLNAADLGFSSVGTSEVENGKLRLEDLAVSDGTVTINVPNIGTGSCGAVATVSTSVNLDNAIILIENATGVSGSIQIDARQLSPGSTSFEVVACNVGAPFDPPSAVFTYAVLGYDA